MNTRESGFTILELLIAVAISTILSTVLLAFTLTYVADVFRSRSAAELAVESHFVLRTMVEDIRLADGIDTINDITDDNAPEDGWTTSDAANQLIINSPATTIDKAIIYDSETGYPYRNQFIYFILGSNLYKRVLSNSNADGNSAVTSCPQAAASSSCPADKNYTSNIENITLEFYDIDNAVTTDPTMARSVKVGLVMSRRSFGKTVTLNNSIQTTLRNY
jgi:prepilin-type N-terminal cleavage/methylation domain-containing protein